MPRIPGASGSKWFTCARCGREYPVAYRRTQAGLEVCTWIPCWDRPSERIDDPSSISHLVPDPPDSEDAFIRLTRH